MPWGNLKYSTDWHLLTRQNSYNASTKQKRHNALLSVKPKIPLPIIDHIHVHQCRLTWCSDNVREMLNRKTRGKNTRPGIYIHVYVYKP
jgi:hypothetical protein